MGQGATRKKISIIGAGMVGGTCAQRIAERGYADVVLVDVVGGLAQGKALDIQESAPVLGFSSRVTGSDGYQATAASDNVIVAAGMPRKPGMSREDLVFKNREIIEDVSAKIAQHSPHCIVIMVANPLDAMVQLALHVTGFARSRVFGQSGILDTSRCRAFVAQELNVSVKDVSAYVLGGHGATMLPLPRLGTVGGVPITEFLSQERIESIIQRTVKGGAEIVNLLKAGSAFYAPSAAVLEMVDAIMRDEKRILPCAAYLEGEYGIKGVVVGVPVKLGQDGIEQIIELKLSPEEDMALKKSAETVRETVGIMNLG